MFFISKSTLSFEEKQIPEECVLKIFKTTLNEFKNRDKYIKDDYRFKDRFSKLNPRKIIHLWAEKEMHNLTRSDSSIFDTSSPFLHLNSILLFNITFKLIVIFFIKLFRRVNWS